MKTTDFIKENFVADAAAAHQDHEVQMARSDCYNAAKYAIELHKLLKNISEQEGLEGWVSEKITLANDYLRTVTEYLRYEQQSGSTDMPEFDVGSATQSLDAALSEGFTWRLRAGGEFLTPYTSNQPYTFKSKEEAIAFAKNRYKGGWEKIVTPTPYDVANALADQPDAGWDEKHLQPVQQEDDEEPQQKRKPVVIKTNKEIGSRVADIGPGGKEYNVKTDKAWDDQHKEVDEERTVTRDETGKIIAWRDESDWRKVDKDKDGRGKVANLSDKARRETEKLQKDQGVEEGKADPTGSWVVYSGSKVKRFKSRDGAKAYAEKTGGKVASSEFYADNIQGKKDVDEGLGKSIKRAAQGWGGSQDKPADIVKRNKAHDTDTAKRLRAGMDDADEHTPQGLQKRVLDRKLKGVAETTSSGSIATSMGGGNGFVNGGPGTIARPKMKKKK